MKPSIAICRSGISAIPPPGAPPCAVFSEACSYTDPLAAVTGHDVSTADRRRAAAVRRGRFVLAGAVDAHHDVARFTWHARAEGREDPLAIGFDVVVLDGDRIKQVVGFLDKVPS